MAGKTKLVLSFSGTTTKHWLIVDAAPAPRGERVGLGLSIGQPPPVTNPLNASGNINNCCANPTVTVWLTDDDGDQTFVTPTLTGGPPPTSWAATFPQMPPGDYVLTVQLTCNNEIISQTMNVTLS